jgi:shikimate kinase
MGVGKTTIGRLLAERLGYGFIDMDMEIEKRTGTTISEIFRKQGETKFRQLESELVRELAEKDNLVIACGGGAMANWENAETMRRSSRMVYLTATIPEIIKRTRRDNERPLLDVPDPAQTAAFLLEKREPVYRLYSEIIIDTTDLTPLEVVEKILEELQ